ncbi:hypothetical protein GGF43_004621, partial [Coemansia sp. RSA 2618]
GPVLRTARRAGARAAAPAVAAATGAPRRRSRRVRFRRRQAGRSHRRQAAAAATTMRRRRVRVQVTARRMRSLAGRCPRPWWCWARRASAQPSRKSLPSASRRLCSSRRAAHRSSTATRCHASIHARSGPRSATALLSSAVNVKARSARWSAKTDPKPFSRPTAIRPGIQSPCATWPSTMTAS